jgi:nucleoside triphosphate diphosphatase
MSKSPIDALRTLMAALRNKTTGCPWDIAQTHQSIAHYAVEEAYELKDAIERCSDADIQSELGDMLLQVVFHAHIADEEGRFNFDDIALSITEKMTARHPHVFGAAEARTEQDQSSAWEAQKAAERSAQDHHSQMDNIPITLPAIARAEKMVNRAAHIGFCWQDYRDIMAKIQEEFAEIEEAIMLNNTDAIAEEIGDALFALINLAQHFKVSAEAALHHTNQKFSTRFRHMEQAAHHAGTSLQNESLSMMISRWNDAKHHNLK